MTEIGIVTGAASGIGAACAEHLVGTVDVLLLADLDEATAGERAEQLSNSATRCEPIHVDVADVAAVARLAATAEQRGTLRRVAHAAGISPTMADWRRMLDVDLRGTALLVDALRPLAGANTAIVCISSMAATLMLQQPDPAVEAAIDEPLGDTLFDAYRAAAGEAGEDPGTAYAWAKHGVRRLVQREAVALGPAGARICSVSPGMIDTPMGRQELEQQPMMHSLEEITPVGRFGRADEIAAAVAFLLSDDASFVTGIDLLVDGGACAAVAVSRPR